MRILVTGAAGFLGRHLIKTLSDKGHELILFVHNGKKISTNYKIIEGDIRNYEQVDMAVSQCNAIFHLAALNKLWHRPSSDFYSINVDGTENLCKAALKHYVGKFIYTSSCEVFGPCSKNEVKDEASTSILRNMTGHYERSKFLAENIIHKYANQGLKAVILRPAAIIGPGDPGNTPGTALIRRLLNLRIPFYYRSGLNLIDVRDVAEGHLAALDKGESGKTYILSGNNIGFDSLLAELNQIVKTDVKLKHINYHLVLALSYLLEFSSYLTRKEPLFTRGAIKTIKHPWYFNNDQTKKALKINPRPLIESLKNTVDFLKTSAERMSKD